MQATAQSSAQILADLKQSSRSFKDWLLDSSIYYSFDLSGFLRHQRLAPQFPNISLEHPKHILITGANSGIGYALCDLLLDRGCQVSMLCRSHERGQKAQQKLMDKHGISPKLYIADITNLNAIDSVATQICTEVASNRQTAIDCLVHNAGLLPNSLSITSTGHELTVGAHLIGPTRLTAKLMDGLAHQARIIFMSSGGMYFAPLDPKQMLAYQDENSKAYDGVFAYALSKRAQVELAQLLHKKLSLHNKQIDVQSIHPGWVDTPGVQGSLAKFHERMQGKLRDSYQGALPAEWLCCLPPLQDSSFWFDWAPRSPYLLGKRPKQFQKDALWTMVCTGANLPFDWV